MYFDPVHKQPEVVLFFTSVPRRGQHQQKMLKLFFRGYEMDRKLNNSIRQEFSLIFAEEANLRSYKTKRLESTRVECVTFQKVMAYLL